MRVSTSVLILLIFLSCKSEKKLDFGDEIKYFDVTFLSHFPEKINYRKSVHAISNDISSSHPFVWLKYFPGQLKLDSIQNSVKSIAIAEYDSGDSCLLVIDRHLTSDNWILFDKKSRNPKQIEYIEFSCQDKKYPVPNFFEEWISETDQNSTKLQGYKMYVLDSKQGLYMSPEKLPNGVYSPKDWEHGYSKGVAINSVTGAVIYWADIW